MGSLVESIPRGVEAGVIAREWGDVAGQVEGRQDYSRGRLPEVGLDRRCEGEGRSHEGEGRKAKPHVNCAWGCNREMFAEISVAIWVRQGSRK